jgi:hypothetical protein
VAHLVVKQASQPVQCFPKHFILVPILSLIHSIPQHVSVQPQQTGNAAHRICAQALEAKQVRPQHVHTAAASGEVIAGIAVVDVVFMADAGEHGLDEGGRVDE